MKPVSELHFRVCDKGLFLPIARRLARDAGKVSYWSPAEKPFTTLRDRIGDGFDDLTRVDSIFQDKDSVDVYVFPDNGFVHEQEELISQGFPVWGARRGDELELMRGKFLDVLATTDLPVPPHERVAGAKALREHLADAEDLYIKTSRYRGDWETFHWRSPEEDQDELDSRLLRMGPLREQVIFYVFEPIKTDIEDGCDTWCIDGEFPSTIVHGMECKDRAFIGTFQRFKDLPEEVRCVNEAFSPILAKYGYRGFFSTEVRITKEGESYFIDPTCRAGSPPSQCMAEMIANYAEVIWQGANGICLDPEPAAKFGVQALLKIGRDESLWTPLKVDGDLDRWVKSAQALGGEGFIYAPANAEKTDCEDWLVGIGDTMEEAIAHLRSSVEELPDGVSCEFASLADLLNEIKSAEEKGMEFTDQPVPEPAIILEKA